MTLRDEKFWRIKLVMLERKNKTAYLDLPKEFMPVFYQALVIVMVPQRSLNILYFYNL